MFGLTLEKLLVVGIIAAVIVGPQRLPHYAERLAAFVRRVRDILGEVKSRAEEESGMGAAECASMDPRRYDPRRIIRDALDGSDPLPPAPGAVADEAPSDDAGKEVQGDAVRPDTTPPAGRWVVAGTSAHPRKVWVSEEEIEEGIDSR